MKLKIGEGAGSDLAVCTPELSDKLASVTLAASEEVKLELKFKGLLSVFCPCSRLLLADIAYRWVYSAKLLVSCPLDMTRGTHCEKQVLFVIPTCPGV